MITHRLLQLAFLLIAGASQAQLRIGDQTTLNFATVPEGQAILVTRDDYIQRLSPFDRSAKITSATPVSEAQYLEAISANVLDWTAEEKEKLTAAFELLRAELEILALPFPAQILLIKTNGNDEGAAPYTRGNAIIFPEPKLQRPPEPVSVTLCHELFHILSRAHPDLRDQLYASIGFRKCPEVSLPPDLQPLKITNPDAPVVEHCIKVQAAGADRWVAPILFAKSEYDPGVGSSFFAYLQLGFITVQLEEGSAPATNGSSQIFQPNEISGFAEQIGRNTGYILHPDEILADNFVLLVQKKSGVPSPEVVEKLGQILKDYRPAAAGTH